MDYANKIKSIEREGKNSRRSYLMAKTQIRRDWIDPIFRDLQNDVHFIRVDISLTLMALWNTQ